MTQLYQIKHTELKCMLTMIKVAKDKNKVISSFPYDALSPPATEFSARLASISSLIYF